MHFEAHITVESDAIKRWQEFCGRFGMRALFIRLSKGKHADQLLCEAPLAAERQFAESYARYLERAIAAGGFRVLRTKLECPLEDASQFRNPVYYECHIKLMLTPAEARDIHGVAVAAGLYPSKNLLVSGERERWYLTMRLYKADRAEAQEKFERALKTVKRHLPVESAEMECAILDTNPAIDAGWLE